VGILTSCREEGSNVDHDFIVVFTVKPGTRLPERGAVELSFKESEGLSKVTMQNIMEPDLEGNNVPTGLRLDVQVKASDIDHAIERARQIADGVTTFASFCSAVGLPVVRAELAYDITPGITDRDFLQFFHDLPVSVSRRTLDPNVMIELMHRVFGVADTEERKRLLRAVRWCRKGSMATEVFEKFIDYWTGLETLNPLLQAACKVASDPTRCPKCKHEWISTPTVSGVRTALSRLVHDGSNFYNEIRRLRVALFHGKSDLERLLPKARDLEASTREALVRSIFFVLGIPPSENFLQNAISTEVPPVLAQEATIHGSDPLNLGPPGDHPHIEVVEHGLQKGVPSEGRIAVTFETKFVARLGPGVTITCQALRLYGQETTLDKLETK